MVASRLPAPPPETDAGWRGRLELGFASRSGRTVVVHRAHAGPLMVQSPFYPEGPVCHCYVLHPPGGIVGGDRLTLTARLDDAAHALLTTPAASKLYRSGGARARVEQVFHVGSGCTLEWLPQETLAFNGTQTQISTRVHLASGARFIGWDALCLGRPASGECFEDGVLRQDLELWCDGQPLMIERNNFAANAPMMSSVWGLADRRCLTTLFIYPAEEHLLRAARDVLASLDDGSAAATIVDNVLVCRALAGSMISIRALMMRLWHVLRPKLLNREASPPRIWAT